MDRNGWETTVVAALEIGFGFLEHIDMLNDRWGKIKLLCLQVFLWFVKTLSCLYKTVKLVDALYLQSIVLLEFS